MIEGEIAMERAEKVTEPVIINNYLLDKNSQQWFKAETIPHPDSNWIASLSTELLETYLK
ncbi:MAG: hypothetical protein PHW04_05505 [Candidatus Wallbacteria bacterium]|nr:hypothetical protein [Candidatus Wallbacteria bacterium]